MHDVNFHHDHELTQHEFLGCCKDCQHSLEIIKPHIMAFADRIRQYDEAALRALPPDDLYRLFLILDDLAHMDAGEHLAELILAEPEINAALPEIRAYYDTFFSIHEVHLAERLLSTSAPWETLKSFPLYPRYEALVKNQIELYNIEPGSRLAFIGCGPVPSSLILLNHLAGIRSVGLEIDDTTAALSRKVVGSLGLEREIDIVHGDETLLRDLDWDTILVAAMAMPKKRIFGNLRRILMETGKTDASVFYRTYSGMRAILHAPVADDDIDGFTIVGRFFPMGRVNNTVVIAKLDG
ncbi:methyltransferase [Desulfosarcina ovata subsp. sediminis]|uniref:Methyltransferase n=1 Tax=Desulfosarcina ovata subsp. sediminis TaxID=885957 RepID=A0A5K7ZRP0_9BACT|nr:nicotianamine synthase family protein [Desulfosarcina ovata]BBO82293.1 methyltransferase [Desulfosarcina ovata subsp. sediminis]